SPGPTARRYWRQIGPAAARVVSTGLRSKFEEPPTPVRSTHIALPNRAGIVRRSVTAEHHGGMASRGGGLDALRRNLDDDGYVVVRRAVPLRAVSSAVRLLNLAIRLHGLSAEEIARCQQTTFFPHLRWEPEIWSVLPDIAAELLRWR